MTGALENFVRRGMAAQRAVDAMLDTLGTAEGFKLPARKPVVDRLTAPRRVALLRLLEQQTPVSHTAIAVELRTLRSLELLGLVEYVDGWQLTEAGRARARELTSQ